MTVIAYRDGILAADSKIVEDDVNCGEVEKIVKCPDGSLAGACGNYSYLCDFLEWAKMEDRDEYDPPKWIDRDCDYGLLILPNGEAHCYYYKSHKVWVNKFIAMGSGQSVALGAFYMGATAEQAVEAAIRYNNYCGGPILTLTLNSVKIKK